ncbi:RHS repeat-associated core domain-containing protein [Roseateles oligotrophus]|uniref:Teneurin-like YD-shell domain-containing protein n=1 Tax=Roseateles oligotrophus TaxID=1769250 RepID=A0ABT2YI64_9BURK|nr:RHS repeat-associated core domain-containing protein [Roseateles oligotrophus]MCV2369752.1 hypothetical protein [Roseateles oligotrophus]
MPQFALNYNSYNADTSRARIDVGLGFGWTHNYSTLLYSVRGHMFRLDGDGRITRYAPGSGGTFRAAAGYFETLVRNPDGSFTLTKKDQTAYRFAVIPATPFMQGTPVFQLTSITDRNNNIVNLSYSGGQLRSIVDNYGRGFSLSYYSNKKLRAVTDSLGRSTGFTYDSSGAQLLKITDPLGRAMQYSYNFLFQLTSKTDKDGRTYRYAYNNDSPVGVTDGAGRALFSMSNPGNWATSDTALAQNMVRQYLPNTTSLKDGRGNVWRYQYDANGYVVRRTAPDGASWSTTYDPGTLMPATQTDPNGRVSSYQYDGQGNLVQRTDAMGNVTRYSYEAVFNQLISSTDANGRVSNYAYDARGNRVQETDPLLFTRRWTYDLHGNVLTETDKNGHTTSHVYDVQGNRIKSIDALGNVTAMSYDAAGNLLMRTDANGRSTSYAYDALDRLRKQTDASGAVSSFEYDAQGNRSRIVDRNGNASIYQYDQRGRLTQVTDALGNTVKQGFDDNDNLVSSIDKNGHSSSFAYDLQNRRNKSIDALGNLTTVGYDLAGNTLSETDANGRSSSYSYDALNRMITRTDAVGSVTRLAYDSTGPCPDCSGPTRGSRLVTRQTDGNGRVIYYKYDGLDRRIKQINKQIDTADSVDGDDAVSSTAYDPEGNPISSTEPNGNTSSYGYDPLNRMLTSSNAAGETTSNVFDPVGNIVSSTAPTTNITNTSYDALNRPVQVQDSEGLVLSLSYDAEGHRLTRADGNGNFNRYAYDAAYRLTQVTDALGNATVYAYDAVGNLLSTSDRNGKVSGQTFDSVNRRITQTDALGQTTQYQYDAVGNLTKLTDANGHATRYAYDGVNRPLTETFANGLSRSYGYDAVGNLLSRTDQNGQTTHYSYNDLYFLTQRSYPLSPADHLAYDLSGRMLSAERGGWLVTFSYDGADRVTQTQQNGATVNYSYNVPARIRVVGYPGGRQIVENMDLRSRLSQIDDASPNLVQYSYDAGDRVLQRSYRNGSQATYSYDANNWLSGVEHSQGVTRLVGFGHAYDKEGNKRFEEKRADASNAQSRSEAYQYDSNYRLIDFKVGALLGATVPVPTTQTQYTLDPVDNWRIKTKDAITETRTHNAVNELTSINGGPPLAYDNNGNLSEDTQYRYAYDEENRLTGVTRRADSVLVGQYQYDALSRRVKKTANPAAVPTLTLYFHDGARIIEEQDSVGSTLASYVYGNTVDELLTMDRAGQSYYYHQNALGSIAAISDAAALPVERYSYDAYGLPLIMSGAGLPLPTNPSGVAHSLIGNTHLFTARNYDEESGLYFYRARYLDPYKGRFIQRDPLGYVAGMNLYAYVKSRPTRYSDPSGNCPKEKLDCEEKLKVLQEKNSDILTKMEKAKCKTPAFSCECCNYSAYYDSSKNSIAVCYNVKSNIETSVRHELIHALDKCLKASFSKCKDWACSEVRANSLSGDCEKGGDFYDPNASREGCIKKYSALSLDIVPNSPCKPGKKYVDAIYTACECKVNDAPPAWPKI